MELLLGDCLEKLKELDDNSVDSIVTDPPYGLAFMGKQWDYDVPSQEIWEECMRVLKPGGHLLSFAGSRTYHRMAVRIEDAGFEIRDQIMWVYGSGFPKSRDIGKDIEKIKVGGIKNLKQVGTKQGIKVETGTSGYSYSKEYVPGKSMGGKQISGDIPVYEITNEWGGWGTALKPAHEPIVMGRKPISEKTVADNVLEWGTGGINIDGCRISHNEPIRVKKAQEGGNKVYGQSGRYEDTTELKPEGRFPANIIFDEEAGKLLDEQTGVLTSGFMKAGTTRKMSESNVNTYGHYDSDTSYRDTYGDSGGASRFFYCPKTSKSDRNEGLDDFETKKSSSMPGRRNAEDMSSSKIDNDVTGRFVTLRQNIHPTVKPTDLMTYLIRLVTPKGGIVLDPFMGSGSTGKAAVREGMEFIGIERENEYFEIAEARINWEINKPTSKPSKTKKVEVEKKVEEKVNQFFG
jgi:site-specific DNA-methyltransferase (adenine-specific)